MTGNIIWETVTRNLKDFEGINFSITGIGNSDEFGIKLFPIKVFPEPNSYRTYLFIQFPVLYVKDLTYDMLMSSIDILKFYLNNSIMTPYKNEEEKSVQENIETKIDWGKM